jgi:hypothetical protein
VLLLHNRDKFGYSKQVFNSYKLVDNKISDIQK